MPKLISIYETNNSKYSIIHLIKKHPVMYSHTYSTMTEKLVTATQPNSNFQTILQTTPTNNFWNTVCLQNQIIHSQTLAHTREQENSRHQGHQLRCFSDILCCIILLLSHKHSTLPNDALRHTTHNCMNQYERTAALYVIYNMSKTIPTIHINLFRKLLHGSIPKLIQKTSS